MDADRFDSIVRALVTTPSRRAVTRALAGVTAASLLAPLLRFTDADAKGKRGRKRKKRKKDKKTQRCGAGTAWCEAGTFSACCSTVFEPGEDDPNEICTHDCGCCDRGFSNCCAGAGEVRCCANTDKCSYGPNWEPFCCPGQRDCGGACCPEGYKCCEDQVCCLDAYTCNPGTSIVGCCGGGLPKLCPSGECRPADATCS